MTTLTAARTLVARVHAQGLVGEGASTVADAVHRVVGLQAQDVRANRLAVRVRTSGLTSSDVDSAVAGREVVRTWAMRGTLHLLVADDLQWIVGLLGPYFVKRFAGRRRRLGLDEHTTERGVAAIDAVLAETGPITRAELVAGIADHGVLLDPKSQAPAHLVGYAGMTGVVCRGPDGAKGEATYVRVADWLGHRPGPTGDEALAQLARRYLVGYGPAAVEDFAAWSGLPLGKATTAFDALADDLEPVTAAGQPAYRLAGRAVPAATPEVRLLGHFDTYLLGYRGRELAVPTGFDRLIQSGGGFIMPAVIDGGRVVGTWQHATTKGQLTVTIHPFIREPNRVRSALQAEVRDLGRFLGVPAVVG